LPSDLITPLPSPLDRTSAQSIPSPLVDPAKEVIAISTLRCNMTISVEPLAAGLTIVEVWATSDSGRSWFLAGQGRDGGNSILAKFPREGMYGYTFVLKSSAGGSQPPAAGETPEGWLEVDTTKPVAEILGVALGTGNDAGHLLVTWVAQDRTFGPEPISLYYASQPTGPWLPLAEKIANTGAYRWPLPKSLSGRVYVRLEATDRAGNSSRCEFATPIVVEASRPRVKVLSITPVGKE
jgi:hypothetical protein